MPGPTEPRCTIPGFASGPPCAALILSFVLAAAVLSHAALAAAEAHPASSQARDPSVESSFLELRELGDRIRTREARAEDATPERTAYPALQSAVAALLPDSAGASAEAMRSAFARGEMDLPPAPSADGASVSGCEKAPARDAPLAALRSWTYACYGLAANAIAIDGRVTDRLTLLADMARSPDPARRRHLLEAMQPMFRTINGDGGEQSPFRRMQPMVAAEWRAGGSPVADNLRALGLDEAQLEPWLVAVLQAWSELTTGDDLEPWDYEYAGNPVERQLGARVPLGRLREINDAFHASLGADIAALNIHYDIERRPGNRVKAVDSHPIQPLGGPDLDKLYAGAPSLEPKGRFASNITPHKDGIGDWSDQDIADFLKSGTDKCFNEPTGMSEVLASTSQLSDADNAALGAYIHALPPKAGNGKHKTC